MGRVDSSPQETLKKINAVNVSMHDMLAVADASNVYTAIYPEAVGKPVSNVVIEHLFGSHPSKALAVEARMLALFHVAKQAEAPTWLIPTAINNVFIGTSLLEAVADEPVLFDGTEFVFDPVSLGNRVLTLSTVGGQA